MKIQVLDLLTVLGIYAKQLRQIRMLFDLVATPEGQFWAEYNLNKLKDKMRKSGWSYKYG